MSNYVVISFPGFLGVSAEPTSLRLQDLPSLPSLTLPSSSDWSLLMPTQLQAPGKSGVVSKKDQEQKPRGDMPADTNLPPRPQVLGPEERDGSCEVSGSPRDSSAELQGRHRKQQILDSPGLRQSGVSC